MSHYHIMKQVDAARLTAPLDVVVVGNVGIDTNVYLPGADIDWQREANFTENLDYVGQAGGFTSRGFAQLGKATAFIGYVGDDYHGQFIRDELTGDDIDLNGLFIDPTGTSRSVNFMYRDGRRKNFYDGKQHMVLQPEFATCAAVLARTRLALFHLPNWARTLLPVAKKMGVTIACDIQDIMALDDPYRHDFINYADILFCSAANHSDPTTIINYLRQVDVQKIVIIGMGAQGCAVGTQAGVQFFPSVALDLPIIDTNGAGDGLAVGFLTSYILEQAALGDAIRNGLIAARYTCSQRASSSRLITAAQLAAYARLV